MNCSQLYIGVNKQLDEQRSNIFSLTLVPSASPEAIRVRSVLRTQYIYALAPHTGCGCGWSVLDIDTPEDALSRQSCDALGRLLNALARMRPASKLYSVCIDSLGTPPHAEQSITPQEFIANMGGYRIEYASKGAKVYLIVPG